ncbi:MAG TPA: histidine kinase [Cyclobacteriaceae bacterium]|nr:histidine kinase [Cyclobacteriaceae bacterium]
MNIQNYFQRNRVLILHFLFWCIYISFTFYQINFYQQQRGYDWSRALNFTLVQLGFTAFVAYLNYFIFLPRFLEHKKLLRYIVEFMIPFIIIISTRIFIQRYMIDGFSTREGYFYSNLYIVQVASITLFISIFVGMLRFVADWFELEAKKKEIENERLMAELNFLKAQINPHFLFNTLNNLYYLAYSKSENTTEVIDKLSKMMRYMIYDSNHSTVLLSKEIEYMQNYISLEQLRLNNEVPINFKVEGDVNQLKIVPLILITFLENAFKHGVTSKSNKSWINVHLKLEGKRCTFIVDNSKQPLPADSKEGKSGIGLQNVQRRLELSYPGKYSLQVIDAEDNYQVELKMDLA